MPKCLVPGLTLLAAVILLVLLNFTTPVGIGPLGVLVFFTTFYILMFGLAAGVVRIFAGLLDRKMGRKDYLYSVILAFGPMMLLILQSMGVMSVWTLALTVLFILIGCFAVNKLW